MRPGIYLLDLDTHRREALRVPTAVLAVRMAERDASVVRGTLVKVSRIFDHRGPVRLPQPVLAKVVASRMEIEEGDEPCIDTVYHLRLPHPVKGYDTGWKAYGRSYTVG